MDDFDDYVPPLVPDRTILVKVRQGELPTLDWEDDPQPLQKNNPTMPTPATQPLLTFDAWKAACVEVVDTLGLPVHDLWDPDDPYELAEDGQAAWEQGVSPDTFIHEVFSEDLARLEGELDEREAAEDYYEVTGEEDYDYRLGRDDEA